MQHPPCRTLLGSGQIFLHLASQQTVTPYQSPHSLPASLHISPSRLRRGQSEGLNIARRSACWFGSLGRSAVPKNPLECRLVHARTHPTAASSPGTTCTAPSPPWPDSPPCADEPEEPSEPAASIAPDPAAPDSPSHPAGDLIEAGSVISAVATASTGTAVRQAERAASCRSHHPARRPSAGPEEDPPAAPAPLRRKGSKEGVR